MKKIHTIQLTADQYKLMLFALGYGNGALLRDCQFELADAVTILVRNLQKQEQPPTEPVTEKVRRVG